LTYTVAWPISQSGPLAVDAISGDPEHIPHGLGAYMVDNNLGDGNMVGEKATISTQRIVRKLTQSNPVPTKLIAASMRNASQLRDLAGVDVFTMPTKVAATGRETLSDNFISRTNENYSVSLNNGVSGDEIGFSKLWEVTQNEMDIAVDLDQDPPANGNELIQRVQDKGCVDMFPILTDQEYKTIAEDGKIPVHATWADRIAKDELAIDTLLNLAGLASFTADQKKLDHRIEGIIS